MKSGTRREVEAHLSDTSFSQYREEYVKHLRYKDQLVNAV